jgi:hypothetical protein
MLRLAVVALFVVSVGIGIAAMFTEAKAAPCRCPMLYAPVICDHDRVYPNMCIAECKHAKNCVPYLPYL